MHQAKPDFAIQLTIKSEREFPNEKDFTVRWTIGRQNPICLLEQPSTAYANASYHNQPMVWKTARGAQRVADLIPTGPISDRIQHLPHIDIVRVDVVPVG